MENKVYGAYLLSGDGSLDKEDFKTEQEAIDYIISFNCKSCQEEGFASACAAEWMVDEVDNDDN